jgi:hypothetical protein
MVKEQTVDGQANLQATTNLTSAQESLQALWEEHLRHEFATHNTEDTIATMVEDAYVNHISVMTGGVGKPALREFYSKYFIPQMPPDLELNPISRTIGTDRLVDEGDRSELALKRTDRSRQRSRLSVGASKYQCLNPPFCNQDRTHPGCRRCFLLLAPTRIAH